MLDQMCVILIFRDIGFVPDVRYFHLPKHWFYIRCAVFFYTSGTIFYILQIDTIWKINGSIEKVKMQIDSYTLLVLCLLMALMKDFCLFSYNN